MRLLRDEQLRQDDWNVAKAIAGPALLRETKAIVVNLCVRRQACVDGVALFADAKMLPF